MQNGIQPSQRNGMDSHTQNKNLIMLKSVILDANALLNAAFISPSWSRRVAMKLKELGSHIYLGADTYAEAVSVAQKLASSSSVEFDPKPILQLVINQLKIQIIQLTDQPVSHLIPKNDRHVAMEALTTNATLLTSDAKLYESCLASGIRAILPLEAIRLIDGPALSTTAFGITPKKNSGSIFVRVTPGNWAGQRSIGQFTLIDFEEFVWIYYCTEIEAWCAVLSGDRRLKIPAQLTTGTPQAISLSWGDGSFDFRVATVDHPVQLETDQYFDSDFNRMASIGRHHGGRYYWNGWINVFVIDDRPIGKSLWQNIRKSSVLTPNPFDLDRLAVAICQAAKDMQ